MIISKTPVRISFFGGGTDYPDYYKGKPGAVLGTTIDKYIFISLNTLSRFFDYKIRIGYSKSELINSIEDIQHPSIRECLKHYDIHEGLDIHIFSDLPAKTGLGSSSAFTVGFLNALFAYRGQKSLKQLLAEKATYVEQKLIHEKVGTQDQFHAAFGGLNVIEFNQDKVRVRPVVISKEKKAHLEKNLMLFYTGINRFAEDILEEQIKKTKTSQNDHNLEKMYQMVFEAESIISKDPPEKMLLELGSLLDQSWKLKRALSSKISNDSVDNMYLKARESGALGGKLCGAGHGGFLLLIVPEIKQDEVRKALDPLLEVQFSFDNEGSSIIYYNH